MLETNEFLCNVWLKFKYEGAKHAKNSACRMELCKTIREHHHDPIIFLTARSDEVDRVVGLEIGADNWNGLLRQEHGGRGRNCFIRGGLVFLPCRRSAGFLAGGDGISIAASVLRKWWGFAVFRWTKKHHLDTLERVRLSRRGVPDSGPKDRYFVGGSAWATRSKWSRSGATGAARRRATVHKSWLSF